MPRILITGNGFDIHHKLPTTYSDFINITKYLLENNDYTFDSVYKSIGSYEIIISTFNNIDFDMLNIEKIKEMSEKNILFHFFQSEFKIETWIDFENKIEYLLSNLFHSIRFYRNNTSGPIDLTRPLTIRNFQSNIIYTEILLFLNILKKIGLTLYFNEKFLIKKYNYYIDIDEQKIIDLLFSQLMEFKKIFNIYLQTFVVSLYNSYKEDQTVKSMFNNIDYYFTFNYTPTFENLYSNENNMFVNYLHGKTESKEENIVLGINELIDNECDPNNYLKFTKYYQKFANKTDYYFLDEMSKDEINENFAFYFWGHSLDKSDASYINEVFDFIDNVKSKIKRITIIYHNDNSRSKAILNLLNIRGRKDIEQKIRQQILIFNQIDSPELESNLNQDISNEPTVFVY